MKVKIMISVFSRFVDRFRNVAFGLLVLVVAIAPISLSAAEPTLGEIVGAIVRVDAKIKPGARTARSLGTERGGSGVVISNDGLIVTIGYLIIKN